MKRLSDETMTVLQNNSKKEYPLAMQRKTKSYVNMNM